MYKHLFGPIPSRRLGTSLGIDLVTHKVCSLDCVYCESGATTDLTVERRDYVDFEAVKGEIKHYLENNPAPDYMTFSGAGEPTLSVRIGETIAYIKSCNPQIKIAVLTNGTLLSDPVVREELLAADLVIPSLDAAIASSFRKINRPEKSIDIEAYIEGIRLFKSEFSGIMPLEILVLPTVNDDKENLLQLKEVCALIQPDYIQLNTLDRPGAVDHIVPADQDQMREIAATLSYPDVRITAKAQPSKKKIVTSDLPAAIKEILLRRPSTCADLVKTIDEEEDVIQASLDAMVARDELIVEKKERGSFYLINHF